MLGLTRRKAPEPEEIDAAHRDVASRLARGDYVGATHAAAALRRAFEAAEVAGTIECARAHALEARAELATGDTGSALERMTAACEIEGDDEDSVRLRLEHEMRLGDMYAELDRLDEAETVLRASLQAREERYGEADPLVGFAAESLGIVLLRREDFAGAASLAERAAAAFRHAEAHKLTAALTLQSVARKALNPAQDVLAELNDEDRELVIAGMAHSPAYLFAGATVDLRWEVLTYLDDVDKRKACLANIQIYAEALNRTDDVARAREQLEELDA